MTPFKNLELENLKLPFLLLIFLFFITSCCGEFCKRENYANELIYKIEKYKQKNGERKDDSFIIFKFPNSEIFKLKL